MRQCLCGVVITTQTLPEGMTGCFYCLHIRAKALGFFKAVNFSIFVCLKKAKTLGCNLFKVKNTHVCILHLKVLKALPLPRLSRGAFVCFSLPHANN